MPNVTRENLGELNAILTIEVSQNDYLPKVNQKLKEYRQKVPMRGFRPGQVPMDLIKRQYGVAILVDEINETINETLSKYVEENQVQYLGQPLAIADNTIKFDINKPTDYAFKFELGLAPEFEIQGLSLDQELPFYEVELEDSFLNEEIEKLRKRFGTGHEEGVEDIQADDLVVVDLQETENGEVKADGFSKAGAYILISRIQNPQLKEAFLQAQVGSSIAIENIYEVEDADKTQIRRYLLDAKPKQKFNDSFLATIKEVKRVAKAELNEDFYKRIFPKNTPTTFDEFKDKVKGELQGQYLNLSRRSFYRALFKHLIAQNKFVLPADFLKKWLRETQKTTEEAINNEFEDFCDNLRWNLMRGKLAQQYNIEITAQDIENYLRGEVLQYFNYQVSPYDPMVNNIIQRTMKDQKAVQRRFDILLDEAVLAQASENVGKASTKISKAEFEALQKEENKEFATEDEA
jgi:trigger factor